MIVLHLPNRHRQDHLQRGSIELTKALLWIHEKLASFEHEESEEMLRKVLPNCFHRATYSCP